MGRFKTAYLNVYNFVNIAGWGYALYNYFVNDNDVYKLLVYKYVQLFMVFDILHVLLRLIKGSIISTILQVASRIYVVLVVIPFQINSSDKLNIHNTLMFTSWTLAETIRYAYYIFKNSTLLKKIRYNQFIILYPVGVLGGELPLIYRHYQSTNFILDLVVMGIYVPFFPYLFVYMLKQRKKQLYSIRLPQKQTSGSKTD